MPHFGNPVDIKRLKTRNIKSKKKCNEIIEKSMANISSTIAAAESTIVKKQSETIYIAAIVSKTITSNGRNKESIDGINRIYQKDAKKLFTLKKSSIEMMTNNYTKTSVNQKIGAYSQGLSQIEYV